MDLRPTLKPEQVRALEYVRRKGTEASWAEIRRRLVETLESLDQALDAVSEVEARRKPSPDRWCVQEIVDHLTVSNRPALAQLRSLQAGESVESAIPASLQSDAPMERSWAEALEDLRAVHEELVTLADTLSNDVSQEARAPVVMVVRCETEGGQTEPVEWIETFDWKAYVLLLRVHVLEHIGQIQRTLGTDE